jgi:hypothetical protein
MEAMKEKAREEVIEKLHKAAEADSGTERMRVPWKSKDVIVPVIELPLNAVVLNPRSHRIRAQLLSHPKKGLIEADPFSSEAQALIADILIATDGFDELRTNLKEVGQREPGVITRAGILVNANTRAVALRRNGNHYIRVGVLPAGATPRDIAEVEGKLQLKKDLKQDYSFTNRLLFIEEYSTDYGYSAGDIALLLGYAPSSEARLLQKGVEAVQVDTRLLAMIREIIELSSGLVTLMEFDDKRQALLEIDAEYERLKKKEPWSAMNMRHTRMIGLLTGVGYRELRYVDAKFFDTHFVPGLQDSALRDVAAAITKGAEPGGELGLDILGGEGGPLGSNGNGSPHALLGMLLKTHHQEEVQLPADAGGTVTLPRESVVDEIRGLMDGAVEEIRANASKGDRIQMPARFLAEATRKLENCRDAYRGVRTDPAFDSDRFGERLKATERMLAALRIEYDKKSGPAAGA